MALASCHVGIVSHKTGRSAIAAAAYRAADKLRNDYDGLTHNYTRKQGVIYSGIMAPENAPERMLDRNTLWNEHQKVQLKKNGELRDDAQLAREVRIALPQELTREQNIELAKNYARVFVKQGMVVDFAVHDNRDGNPHSHYLLTMRDINEDGFSKKKNGNWDRNDYLIGWRKSYEDITNRYLEMNGFDQRICVDSYEKQGIDKIPTIHLGAAAHHMEQRGIETDRGNINRGIQEANREKEINREIDLLRQDAEYIKGSAGYSDEKEQDEYYRAAESGGKYSVPDADVAPHSMGAEEEEYITGEPISGISAEDLIEHYKRTLKNIKETAEALDVILTEKGKQSLSIQQRNIENALERLTQQQAQKLKETPAPETVRPSVPEPEPSIPSVRQIPEPQPGSSETELFRQQKLALERESKLRGEDAGGRSPSRDPSSLYSGGRTLAQQRRIARERQEQQKPDERTKQPASSPAPHEGRTLAQQRRTAQERQEQEQRQAKELKPEQAAGSLPRQHESESLAQQRKIALDRKNKDPVPEVYKGQHHERGDDVRRMAPDDRGESHHEAERGRVRIMRHDYKKP